MPRQRDYAFEREATPYPARATDYGAWLAKRGNWQLFATTTVRDHGGDAVLRLKAERYGDAVAKAGSDSLEARVAATPALAGFTHVGVGGAERFVKRFFRESIRSRGFAMGTRPYAAVAMEFHKDRVTPHHHWLIGGLPEWLVRDNSIGRATKGREGGSLWREWYEDHGHVRIDTLPTDGTGSAQLGAAVYAAKYMTKDGGRFYALGKWPQVSEYDDGTGDGEEVEDRWTVMPGAHNAERVWREFCEGAAVQW